MIPYQYIPLPTEQEIYNMFKIEDINYIDYLKNQLKHFNKRKIIRKLEGEDELTWQIEGIIKIIKEELESRQNKLKKDFPNENKPTVRLFERNARTTD